MEGNMIMTIDEIIQRAADKRVGRVAVAAAEDDVVLSAVCKAYDMRIAVPILFGNGAEIRRILKEEGRNPDEFEIIDTKEPAKEAVACVREGRANMLLKGLINTADLMKEVINKETGIRTGHVLSHVMLHQTKDNKMYALTDGGVIPFPDLQKKVSIIENCADVLHTLGYNKINCACICGAENFNPKMQAMVDTKELIEMKDHWKKYNVNVYGPVGLDLAISKEACEHKHYNVQGAGEADILLVPNYEVGNAMGKAMTMIGGTRIAGVIVGAKVPILLVSRSDPEDAKLASIALGAAIA